MLAKRAEAYRLEYNETRPHEAKGKLRGKQPKLKPGQAREVRRMHDSGDYTVVEIAEMFNVSRPTVYRTLERVPESQSPPAGET